MALLDVTFRRAVRSNTSVLASKDQSFWVQYLLRIFSIYFFIAMKAAVVTVSFLRFWL